jgi:hypothetical protein
MEKVRGRLNTDPKPDDTIAADRAAGQKDHLDRTPLAVIVSEGHRQAITDAPLSFETLKSHLDRLLEKN